MSKQSFIKWFISYHQKKGEQELISVAEKKKPSGLISGISEDALETLAEALYPDILEFFNSEEGQKEFAEWKASQQNKT